jgi:serine/threonine-protein kinase
MRDPERFRQIDALFDAALELPDNERGAWLDRSCAGDALLRTEVEALLGSVRTAASLFGENVAEFAAPLLEDLPDDPDDDARLSAGERLGAWRILEEIGHGGMGTVYLAERADGAFDKRVAVKVVKRGMDTAEVLRRFSEERRILASLDHPNVARLLDGGATADGRPFIVMEYVEGERIDRWCDGRRLGLRDRVRLFRDLCEAVHQAHRRLVVHRDVKPSNVLVTQDGVPKLLDFGIAKLLESDDRDLTLTGARLLTPEYAAPEQVGGQPVTTATDVYALGRLLYELLAGVRPSAAPGTPEASGPRPAPPPSHAFAASAARQSGAADGRASIDMATIADSRGTTPDRLRAALRGDLDTIVLRAMASEPGRRYASAAQLAEDLERWLDGRPVNARPDSVGYRVSKFVRRNPAGSAAAVAFILLLITFAAYMASAQRRTAAALVRAENERDTAEEVAALLEGILSAGDPTAMRAERLDTFRVSALLDRSNARVRADLGDRPRVQARLLHAIGDAYRGLGMLDSASAVLSEAVAAGRTTTDTTRLASSINALALISLQRGQPDRAEPLIREALELRRAALPEGHTHVIQSLGNLAAARQDQGDFEGAAELYAQALEQIDLAETIDTPQLTALLNGQGMLAQRAGNFELAATTAGRILEMDRARLGPVHPRVALDLANMGLTRMRAGQLDEADSLISASVDMFLETVGDQHPMYFNALASAANVRALRGRRAEAKPMFEAAIEGMRRVLGPGASDVAITLTQYADLLAADGHLEEAVVAVREAHTLERNTAGPDHPNTGVTRSFIARFECRLDRFDAASAGFRESLDIVERALPPTHPRVISIRDDYAICLMRAERYEEAERTLIASFETLGGSTSSTAAPPAVRAVAARLIELYEAWNRPDRAAAYRAIAADTARSM